MKINARGAYEQSTQGIGDILWTRNLDIKLCHWAVNLVWGHTLLRVLPDIKIAWYVEGSFVRQQFISFYGHQHCQTSPMCVCLCERMPICIFEAELYETVVSVWYFHTVPTE